MSQLQDGVNIGVGGTNRRGGPRPVIVQGLQAGLEFAVAGVGVRGHLLQGAELPLLLLLTLFLQLLLLFLLILQPVQGMEKLQPLQFLLQLIVFLQPLK